MGLGDLLGGATSKGIGGLFSFGKKIDPLTLGASGDKTPQELLWGSEREMFSKLDPDLQETVLKGREAQRGALDKISALSSEDPTQMIRSQIEREKTGVTAGVGDLTRKLQEIRAQRGLGSSSVGLGQIRQAKTQAAEKLGQIEGTFGERLRNLRRQQATDLLTSANQVLGTQGAFRKQQIKKTQGLAPGIGAVLGGIFGGPAGAQAGAGAGQAMTGTFGPGDIQTIG